VKCIENLRNIIWNIWEHAENMMEHKNKKLHPHTPHTLKVKKMNPLGCMFSYLIGSMHILFLDMVVTKRERV
jgi:hypothetical protein